MTSRKFHDLFGGPPREPDAPLTERTMNLAASIQAVTEEIMLRLARHVHRETGMKNLVLAGGVALNCVGNGRILREGPFENLWIQPAAGDAGGALGAAMFIWHQPLENPRAPQPQDHQRGSLLGPQCSESDIAGLLDEQDAAYSQCSSDEELCREVANLVAEQKVVGWFQGRMEFGPRALGARSILGDARSPKMQSLINQKIKFRESFRPFAPIVLRDQVDRYFEMRPYEDSPYMLLVAPVCPAARVEPADEAKAASGLDKLKFPRSTIPAVTHVDNSARVQTVDEGRNPLLHQLLSQFFEQTGCPVMINTSFNVRGEPIVCTPEEALRCFRMTDMDALVLGRHILRKQDQRDSTDEAERRAHLAQIAPD